MDTLSFMKTFLPLFLFVSLVSTSVFADHHSDKIQLFNGKDLNGWIIENNGQFVVEDGLIKLNQGSGWLRTDKMYSDFALTIEFRFLETLANSGIFVRTGGTSNDDESGYPNDGYQIQCHDSIVAEHPIATLIPYGAPVYYQSYSHEALEKAYRPAGEWQTYEIVCLGESLKISLNGEVITRAVDIKNLEGYIGIQGEHGFLEFRKFELTEL